MTSVSDVAAGANKLLTKSLSKTSQVSQNSQATKKENLNSKSSVSKTNDTQALSSAASSAELKEEIEALQKEKEHNLQKMEMIEEEMQKLAQEASDNILEAAKKQEQAVAEHEQDAKEALDSQIKKYIEANKEGGDGMSKSQLQTNIKNSMPNTPNIAAAMAKLLEANEQIAKIDSLLGSLNMLISDVKLLDVDINTKTSQYDAALKAEQEAAKRKSCDPIGFTLDTDKGKVKYDFIVDDGAFDSTSDFLGADKQWAEMQALDTSGDGIVSTQELSQKNIKAVKTNPDGTQEIVDLAKEFGSDFSIDLSSYQQGGSHEAVSPTADHDGDGILDQDLLGTFNVNINNQSIKGYNTLDDVDYLEKEYNIKDSREIANSEQISSELQPHVNFFEEYSVKNVQLQEDLITGYETLGLAEDNIQLIDKQIKTEANKQANIFMDKIEKDLQAKEAQEAKEKAAQEAKEAKEAELAEEGEEDEEESPFEFMESWTSKVTYEDLNVQEDAQIIKDLKQRGVKVTEKTPVERLYYEDEEIYRFRGQFYDIDGNKIEDPSKAEKVEDASQLVPDYASYLPF